MLKTIGMLILLTASAPAQAEQWCLSDLSTSRQTCVFSSLRDCVRAAAIVSGRCERQSLGRRPGSDGRPSRRERHSGR